MTKLFFIEASPPVRDSDSIRIADAYLKELRTQDSAVQVDRVNLWNEDLPPFDAIRVTAKENVMTGRPHNSLQKAAWNEIVRLSERFTGADRYLLAVPMWNNSIPYRLKHYIDLIHQPGLTFGLRPESGFFGLLRNKQATLVLTAGINSECFPAPAFGEDFHSTYLRSWLNQTGIVDIDEIRFQPSLLTVDPAGEFAKAEHAAIVLAQRHAHCLQQQSPVSIQ